MVGLSLPQSLLDTLTTNMSTKLTEAQQKVRFVHKYLAETMSSVLPR